MTHVKYLAARDIQPVQVCRDAVAGVDVVVLVRTARRPRLGPGPRRRPALRRLGVFQDDIKQYVKTHPIDIQL